MNARILVNALLLQGLWFASILGAANHFILPAAVWLLVFMIWNLAFDGHAKSDTALIVVAAAAGFLLDSLWVRLGWLNFSHAGPLAGMAPVWIVMLWIGLALTLNHSLRWLQHRLLLAGALSMASAPLSYLAASRLGAVEIVYAFPLLFTLSLSWAVLVPALLLLARTLREDRAEEQRA